MKKTFFITAIVLSLFTLGAQAQTGSNNCLIKDMVAWNQVDYLIANSGSSDSYRTFLGALAKVRRLEKAGVCRSPYSAKTATCTLQDNQKYLGSDKLTAILGLFEVMVGTGSPGDIHYVKAAMANSRSEAVAVAKILEALQVCTYVGE